MGPEGQKGFGGLWGGLWGMPGGVGSCSGMYLVWSLMAVLLGGCAPIPSGSLSISPLCRGPLGPKCCPKNKTLPKNSRVASWPHPKRAAGAVRPAPGSRDAEKGYKAEFMGYRKT